MELLQQQDMSAGATSKISDLLECPVCLGVPSGPPVFRCQTGHLLCKDCYPKLGSCPICRVKLPKVGNRCLTAEKLLDSFEGLHAVHAAQAGMEPAAANMANRLNNVSNVSNVNNLSSSSSSSSSGSSSSDGTLTRNPGTVAARLMRCPDLTCDDWVPAEKLQSHLRDAHSEGDFSKILKPFCKFFLHIKPEHFTKETLFKPAVMTSWSGGGGQQAKIFYRECLRTKSGVWCFWVYTVLDRSVADQFVSVFTILENGGARPAVEETCKVLTLDQPLDQVLSNPRNEHVLQLSDDVVQQLCSNGKLFFTVELRNETL